MNRSHEFGTLPDLEFSGSLDPLGLKKAAVLAISFVSPPSSWEGIANCRAAGVEVASVTSHVVFLSPPSLCSSITSILSFSFSPIPQAHVFRVFFFSLSPFRFNFVDLLPVVREIRFRPFGSPERRATSLSFRLRRAREALGGGARRSAQRAWRVGRQVPIRRWRVRDL